MISPTGIIPEELMYPQKKADTIRFIQSQPFPADFKEKLLLGWAMTVGIALQRKEYQAVHRSGVDV